MGTVLHSAYTTVTTLTPAGLNAPLGELDEALIKRINVVAVCDSTFGYSTGLFHWGGSIRVRWNTTAGVIHENVATATSIAVAANSMAFVTLTTASSVVTIGTTALTTGTTNLQSPARVPLVYRGPTSTVLYPVTLRPSL